MVDIAGAIHSPIAQKCPRSISSLGLSANRGQQNVGFLDIQDGHATTFQGGVAGGSGAFNILNLTGDGAGGGGITVENGTVTIGTATGGVQVNVMGSQTIRNDSSLTFNNGIAGVSTGTNVLTFLNAGGMGAGFVTVNGPITDSTTESQAGSVVAVVWSERGILQYSVPNGYSGGTTVNSGILSVTNTTGSATGSGFVTVNGGPSFGTLSGAGIIAGPVTINAGPFTTLNAVINPRNPANGLSTLTLNGGLALHGTYNATIDPNGTASSLLSVAGLLDLTGGSSMLNVALSAAGTPSATYTLATFGALNGTFSFTNLPAGYAIHYLPTSITISPVPEPTFLLVICATGAAMCGRRRRSALDGRSAGPLSS